MRYAPFLIALLVSSLINAQQPINDPHPLIGKLNGSVSNFTVTTRLTDPYNPPRTDTLVYTLNSTRDTARLVKNGSITHYALHIYNKEKELIKQVSFYPGNHSETVYKPQKHKLTEIITEKNTYPDYIRTDTTKSYYDKSGRLLKRIESNNQTRSRFTTTWTYDQQGNVTSEKWYTYSPEINSREELTKHMQVSYSYDDQKNWITKGVSYLSVQTGEVYQTIYSTRSISYRKEQNTLLKTNPSSAVTYFTVINWINLAYKDADGSAFKINEGGIAPAYNLQTTKLYFENIIFSSTKSKEEILYQAFLTINEQIRKKQYYTYPDSIAAYFLQKYDIGFFYNEAFEKGQKFEKSFTNLERHITLDDFKKIILRNFKIELIKKTDINKLSQKAPFTLIYNWDFFEELSMSPKGMNILLRNMHNLPVSETLHAADKTSLQLAALENLDIWTYNADSRLTGLKFAETDFIKYKCADLKLPFCSCIKTITGYEVAPFTRNIKEIFNEHYKNDKTKFDNDFQAMLDFLSQKISPFSIWNKKGPL